MTTPKFKIEWVPINKVKKNPKNPRTIKDTEFDLLVKSIQEFPEMLEIRPIVVNDKWIVLGGNRRYDACKAAGLKTIPIIRASSLTEAQQRRFKIVDNKASGDWDFDMLRSDWDQDELLDWGIDVPLMIDPEESSDDNGQQEKTSFKIEISFKNESQQNKAYNKFIAEGFDCRLLS